MKKIFSGYKKEQRGSETIYLVFVSHQWVEVSKEVFDYMKSNDRRQRYLELREAVHREFSIEEATQQSESFKKAAIISSKLQYPSPEEEYLKTHTNQISSRKMNASIRKCIKKLSGFEHDLAYDLIINHLTYRECAEKYSLPLTRIWRDGDQVCKEVYNECKKELGL